MNKIKIRHIFHSGFEIEMNGKTILIDVYNHIDQYKNKDIICFVTHSHSDHFNPEILTLQDHNKVVYVVSEDVPMDASDTVYKVKKGDVFEIEPFQIKVFGTTDLGVSYLIKTEENTIFHSGDLNWWHWDHDTKEHQENEKKQYFEEIALLEGEKIDFAFVPVDNRLHSANRYAMDYFIKNLNPKYLIPMHFGHEYETIRYLETDSDTILIKSNYPNTSIY